jgi:2-iminobutanoate/2-iminopropanoate deaminase
MRLINDPNAPQAIGPYSQAVKTGGLIFCSGQIPLNPATGQLIEGDIEAATRQVFGNIEAVLGAAGATLADIVKVTVFLTDLAEFGRMNAVYQSLMGDHKPARSTVQVAALPRGVKIEIEAIARVGS